MLCRASEGFKAGFERNDCILEIGGKKVQIWTDPGPALISRAGETLTFRIMRSGKEMTLSMPADNSTLEGLQAIGLLPFQEAVIGAVAPQMPAAAAGLHEGDRIVAIGDHAVTSWYDLKEIIQKFGGKTVPFQIIRKGQNLTVDIYSHPGICRWRLSDWHRTPPEDAFQEIRFLLRPCPPERTGRLN